MAYRVQAGGSVKSGGNGWGTCGGIPEHGPMLTLCAVRRGATNHAADLIVTRFSSVTGNLEVVIVVRSDCDMIALPGGMVNPGEDVAKTLYSEFTEEAARPNGAVERLFAECKRRTVYKGPVDRPTHHR